MFSRLPKAHVVLVLVILSLLAVARNAAAQETTPNSAADHIAAPMDDLSAELRERAKALGYNDGETVNLRLAPSGELIVLPRPRPVATPAEEDAKASAVIREKIVRRVTPDLKVQWLLDAEAGEVAWYEVRVPYSNLQKPVQTIARQKGYANSDEITIEIDAKTWAYEVKEKALAYSTTLDEVIPGKTPDDPSTFRVTAKFDELPPEMQAQARALGYGQGDSVRMETSFGEKWSVPRILPPLFALGIRKNFDDMKQEDQAEAVKLGYKSGDTVWLDFAKGFAIRPADQVGDGPVGEVVAVELVRGKPTPIVVSRFNRLKTGVQRQARELGYKEGDNVGFMLDAATKKPRLLKPGEAEFAAEASRPASQSSSPFALGIRKNFDDMKKEDQAEAARLGYKSGDAVWHDFDNLAIRPADRVGDGPMGEVVAIKLVGGKPNPIAVCRFDKMNPSMQREARELGYKEGDNVGFMLDAATKKRQIVKPGEAELAAETSGIVDWEPAQSGDETGPEVQPEIPVEHRLLIGVMGERSGRPAMIFTTKFIEAIQRKSEPTVLDDNSMARITSLLRDALGDELDSILGYSVKLDQGIAYLAFFERDGRFHSIAFSESFEPRILLLDSRRRAGLYASDDRLTIPCGKAGVDVRVRDASLKRRSLVLDTEKRTFKDQLVTAFPKEAKQRGPDTMPNFYRKGVVCSQ